MTLAIRHERIPPAVTHIEYFPDAVNAFFRKCLAHQFVGSFVYIRAR